jgi:hypothetical protein
MPGHGADREGIRAAGLVGMAANWAAVGTSHVPESSLRRLLRSGGCLIRLINRPSTSRQAGSAVRDGRRSAAAAGPAAAAAA